MQRALPCTLLALFLIIVIGSNGRVKSVEIQEIPGYNSLWQGALQKLGGNPEAARKIKTVLSPYQLMLVPGYHRETVGSYGYYRKKFLFDYILEEFVNPEDPRIATPEGLTLINFNGKPVTFKIDDRDGVIIVNGVSVMAIDNFDDDVITYHISELLFDHEDEYNDSTYLNFIPALQRLLSLFMTNQTLSYY